MLILNLVLALAPYPAQAADLLECIPMGIRDGKVQIFALCDAQAVNARWQLKVDPQSGCAVKNQMVQRQGVIGQVLRQGSLRRRGGEESTPRLRDCRDEEAIDFATH